MARVILLQPSIVAKCHFLSDRLPLGTGQHTTAVYTKRTCRLYVEDRRDGPSYRWHTAYPDSGRNSVSYLAISRSVTDARVARKHNRTRKKRGPADFMISIKSLVRHKEMSWPDARILLGALGHLRF